MFYLGFYLKPVLHEQQMHNEPWVPNLCLQAPDDFIAHECQSKIKPRLIYEGSSIKSGRKGPI